MTIRQLTDLPFRKTNPVPWVDIKPNFPWDDPEFSKRMLVEHLDPSHPKASRTPKTIKKEIRWLNKKIFAGRDVKTILDLTCGPGLYANEFARMGYTVKGIDISPAAIDHARTVAADEKLPATFIQADVAEIWFGGGFDAAIFMYGLPNAFTWDEFAIIMIHLKESVNPGGVVVLEFHRKETFERTEGSRWYTSEGGRLFGDNPVLVLEEHFYHKENNTSAEVHYVVDLETFRVRQYSICNQAYTIEDIEPLLMACGMKVLDVFGSMSGGKPKKSDDMMVVVAERTGD